jgi:hypothetical protein
MRDTAWLEKILDTVWKDYFSDIPKLNKISISFGRMARRRLASIRQTNRRDKKSDTKILVTGFYKNETVPERIVRVTIAHELCHYAHGFASPLPQFSKFPHRGDIVDDELRKRGLGVDLDFQEKWLKNEWVALVGVGKRKKSHFKFRFKFF